MMFCPYNFIASRWHRQTAAAANEMHSFEKGALGAEITTETDQRIEGV